jgi:CheY-like chemotaxis protein
MEAPMTKILYVEDNDDNIYMITRRLSRYGFEVIVAKNGEEGLAKVRSEDPAVILMDLDLPVLDGWDDFFSKPVDLKDLLERIESFLPEGKV